MLLHCSSRLYGYRQRLYQLRPLFFLLLLLQLEVYGRFMLQLGRLPFPGEAVYSTVGVLLWSSLPPALLAAVAYRPLRRVLMWLVVALASFLFLFEHYLIYTYNSLYTDSIALNILATNSAEASNFISEVHWLSLLSPLILLIVLLVLAQLMARKIKRSFSQRAEYFPLIALAPSLGIFSLLVVQPVHHSVCSPLQMAAVERIWHGTRACVEAAKSLEVYVAKVKRIDIGQAQRSTQLGQTNVILILGESLRRDYMHCYGYPLPNTPGLDSLAATGDLVLFSDVVSSTSYTSGSISESMTFYTREQTPREWFDFPTLPSVLSRVGYYSYWLSNQEAQGSGIQPVGTIARTADSTRFAKQRSASDWSAAQDEVLLPLLFTRANLPSGEADPKALFEVVHLMGSHTPYGGRFTQAYARFRPEDLPAKLPNGMSSPRDERAQTLAQYVNSVYYNDFIVRSIIQHYASSPSIVIYLSDHGQALFENAERPDYFSHEVSAPGVRVPLMVYMSPSLRAAQPELYSRVLAAKDRRIMTDLLSNSICGLLGVQMKYYDSSLDFFSSQYDNSRKRLVYTYDKEFQEF